MPFTCYIQPFAGHGVVNGAYMVWDRMLLNSVAKRNEGDFYVLHRHCSKGCRKCYATIFQLVKSYRHCDIFYVASMSFSRFRFTFSAYTLLFTEFSLKFVSCFYAKNEDFTMVIPHLRDGGPIEEHLVDHDADDSNGLGFPTLSSSGRLSEGAWASRRAGATAGFVLTP